MEERVARLRKVAAAGKDEERAAMPSAQMSRALAHAAAEGDVSNVQGLLAEGANPNALVLLENVNRVDRATALIFATRCGQAECVEVLLRGKADANAKSVEGVSALDVAKSDDLRCRKLLLDAGAVSALKGRLHELWHDVGRNAVARRGTK